MVKKALVAVIVLPFLAAAVWLFLPWWRAHRLLAQVSKLEVGKSSFADAQRLAERIGATASSYCTTAECDWYRRVDNSSLPQFWIGEGASLTAGFRVRNSVVDERGIAEQIGSSSTVVAYVDVEERTQWSGAPPRPVSVQTQWTAHVPRYSAMVMMVPTAPPDIRKKYTSFNLSCLWRFGGCTDAKQLLPVVEWTE